MRPVSMLYGDRVERDSLSHISMSLLFAGGHSLFFPPFSLFLSPFHCFGVAIGIEARFDAGELRGVHTPTLCAKRLEEPPG